MSTQVLQEHFTTATRKLGLSATAAREWVTLLGRLDLITPGLEDLLAAIDLHRLHSLSI